MEFSKYQERTVSTAKLGSKSAEAKLELAFGLGVETGSVLNIYKLFLRDNIELEESKHRLEQELGDVLWYLSMLATTADLSLETIVEKNLERTAGRYGDAVAGAVEVEGANLDKRFPKTERFPRQMVFEFQEEPGGGDKVPHVGVFLRHASPNAFQGGASKDPTTGKRVGFDIGQRFGNSVNDNSNLRDGYRYHDAIHMSYAAHLGWSPVLRALLRLKRKSDAPFEVIQDGARSIDLEEAITALLAALSYGRMNFKNEANVDGAVLDAVKPCVVGLEVENQAEFLWRKAIHRGFSVMHELIENKGGFVSMDLDKREISFSKSNPLNSPEE